MKKVIIFLIFSLSFSAYSKLDFEDHAFPEFMTSGRALGMGNAYINKVDDSWAAFYNPAGLGSVRRPQFHLANVHLELSNGLLALESANSIDEIKQGLLSRPGDIVHSRLGFFPNVTVRGLTLGYFYNQRNRAVVTADDSPNGGKFEVADRRDQGPVMALSGSLFGGVLKLGGSAIYLGREEFKKEFDLNEEVDVSGKNYSKGKSLQLTTGAKLVAPVYLLPTFSVVLRNATNNDFEDIKSAGSPEKIKQTMDAAFSITPQIARWSRIHLEYNLRDIHNAYKTNAKRRASVGMEVDLLRTIFLRVGSGDGWGSAGVGLKYKSFLADFSTYAVDPALEGFREKEDRRWVLSFSFGP